MTLRERVLAAGPVDQGLREQDAAVGGRRDDLVRVAVVALANTVGRRRLALEVEARVDLILAVREEEVHRYGCAIDGDLHNPRSSILGWGPDDTGLADLEFCSPYGLIVLLNREH